MSAIHSCRKAADAAPADTITKDYVKDAGVFAGIFDYYIYGGRRSGSRPELSCAADCSGTDDR